MQKRLRLSAVLAALVALLVLPGLAAAGAGDSVPATGPDNESSTAWFVQLAGAPTAAGGSAADVKSSQSAFYSNAAAMGVKVTRRQQFGTLWNGVSVSVSASQVGALSSVPGVVAVYPVGTVSLPPSQPDGSLVPDDVGSNAMVGVDPTGGGVGPYKGQGIKVAVIDSGIDYTNPDLGGCAHFGDPSCRVVGGYDFVGNSYDNTPTDADYQPVAHPGSDPAPCDPNVADAEVAAGRAAASDGGHGTHVAGIIGARAANANGVTGVAPDVSFLAYKVFGCNGSTADDNVVAALERAYQDGAQVVNISTGDDYASWPEDPAAQAADALVQKGVVVVAAVGNVGGLTTGLFSAADPSVGNGVLAVGSVDNAKVFLPYFEFGSGQKAGYVNGLSTSAAAPTSGGGTIVRTSATPTPAAGGCAPFAPGSLTGSIALIRRGGCSFNQKAFNAQSAGAAGVVFYNNLAGFLPVPNVGGGPAITIPVVGVSDTEGLAIYAAAGTTGTPLTWTSSSDYFPNTGGGVVSSFSSWGPTAELGLKPDLSAPGALIRSTWPTTQLGGHAVMSGTSAASPHVAGAAAVLLSAGKSPAGIGTLLSNNAQPLPWNNAPSSGILESPLREGAGLIKVDSALAATTSVSPRKISLGEGLGGSQILTLTNTGSSAVTYTPTFRSAVSPQPAAGWPNTFGLNFGQETVTFSAPTVTVPAGGQATITATVNVAAGAPDGELYDGFIRLQPDDGGTPLTVPYAGYKGDYQAQQVLTPTANGLPWLARLSGGSFTHVIASGSTFTLAGGDDPYLVYHLNIPARQLNVQVENADGSFVHPVFNYAVKESFLPRNSSPTAFFTFAWDGTRGQDNGNDKRKVVPNGTYALKLSVLKPLGDPSSSADWETFTTPAFTIARP